MSHPERYYVLFHSSFRYDAAPSVSHETIDKVRTLCGRKVNDAETLEPDSNNLEPDCLRCQRALARRRKAHPPAPLPCDGTHLEARVRAIMAPFSQPWRWFCDGTWIVLEPPHNLIAAETLHCVHQHPDVHTVEAVFRATPSVGIYLRFHLR